MFLSALLAARVTGGRVSRYQEVDCGALHKVAFSSEHLGMPTLVCAQDSVFLAFQGTCPLVF